MPTVESNVAVAEKSVKTAAKKTAAKKPEVKGAKKAPVASKNGAEKKSGLRKPQERILKALAKHGALTRLQISEKADVDPAMGNYLGASDPENYASYSEKYGFLSLLSLKMVKNAPTEEGAAKYEITDKGRKALEAK